MSPPTSPTGQPNNKGGFNASNHASDSGRNSESLSKKTAALRLHRAEDPNQSQPRQLNAKKDAGSQKYPSQASNTIRQPLPPPQQLPNSASAGSPTSPHSDQGQQQQEDMKATGPTKKVGRSSKPIIDWLQRKLAVRSRRPSDVADAAQLTANRVHNSTRSRQQGRQQRRDPSIKKVPSTPSLPATRNSISGAASRKEGGTKESVFRPNTISLNGDDEFDRSARMVESDDERSTRRSSLARDSTYSPSSPVEADEDASMRPFPPSSPPSPSPSRSSSSYLSDPRTFKSMAASTKPTTILSVDLTANGMAHIAQAPPTPASQIAAARMSTHRRGSSTGTATGAASITFSALPPQQSSSRSPSLLNPTNLGSGSTRPAGAVLQAPQHTTHHPRNNPRPSSPPPDDASVLTLASSAFGMPGARIGAGALGSTYGGTNSVTLEDSQSRFDVGTVDSTSHFALTDDVDLDRDVDASVRALRPRSSRRGSWESEASGWSARVGGGASGTTPLRERWDKRSFGGSYSLRTGNEGADTLEDEEEADGVSELVEDEKEGEETMTEESATEDHLIPPMEDRSHTAPSVDTSSSHEGNLSMSPPPSTQESTPTKQSKQVSAQDYLQGPGLSASETARLIDQASAPDSSTTPPLTSSSNAGSSSSGKPEPDAHSIMTATDVFNPAPLTPMTFS